MADKMMEAPVWDKIEGRWNEFKGNVRKQWGKLTDDDVEQIKGNRDVLAGRLQQRYGLAKEEINQQIDKWAHDLKF
jgi:uncharacterized protein YjbJ (UPF0337 family)